MVTAMLTYSFPEVIDLQNLSTPETDAALYKFLANHLQDSELIDAREFLEVDNQFDYIEFPDKPEAKTFIEIIADIPHDLLDNHQTASGAVTAYLHKSITPENLVYEDHRLCGNNKYFIVKMIRLEESFI